MAGIIPQVQQSVGMDVKNPVPIARPDSAGIADMAKSDMYAQFGKAANAISDHVQKQQDMEDKLQTEVYVNKVKDNMMLAKDQALRDSADDGSDYLENFKKNVDASQADTLKGIEDYPGAQDQVESYQKIAMNTMSTQITMESAKLKEASNYKTMEGLADKSADRIRQNPTPGMVAAETQTYGNMLDGFVKDGSMTPKNRVKVGEAYNAKMSQQYVEGLAEKGQYTDAMTALSANQENPDLYTKLSPADAKSLGFIDSTKQNELEGTGQTYDVPVMTNKGKNQLTPQLSEIMNGMDPKTKSHYIDAIQNKAKAEGAMKMSDLNSQISGFETVAIKGGQYSDSDVGAIKAAINNNPYLDGQARVRLNNKVNVADAVNKSVQLLADVPRDQWNQVVAGFDKKVGTAADHAGSFDPKMAAAGNDFAVQADRMEGKEKLKKAMDQVAKQQDEYPAEYVVAKDKGVNLAWKAAQSGQPADVQNYAQAALAKQDQLGISKDNQAVLPNAGPMAGQLKNQPNSYDAANFINDLEHKYGPYFPHAMKDIISNDKDLKNYTATIYAPPNARTDIVDALRNAPANEKAFAALPGNESLHATIKQSSGMALQGVQQALMNGSSDGDREAVVGSLRAAMELQVKRDLVKNPNADPTALMKKAYDTTIDSQFNIEGGAVVPKQINGMNMEPGVVAAFTRAYSDPSGIAELHPLVPASYKGDADQYNQAIARNGKWRTNDTFDGLELKMVNPETGRFMPVMNKLGKPITVQYKDINLNPTDRVKRQDSFMGRMFDGAGRAINSAADSADGAFSLGN